MEGGKLNLIEKFVYELAIPRSLLIDISVLASGGGYSSLSYSQTICV